jgi:hypothetical protein
MQSSAAVPCVRSHRCAARCLECAWHARDAHVRQRPPAKAPLLPREPSQVRTRRQRDAVGPAPVGNGWAARRYAPFAHKIRHVVVDDLPLASVRAITFAALSALCAACRLMAARRQARRWHGFCVAYFLPHTHTHAHTRTHAHTHTHNACIFVLGPLCRGARSALGTGRITRCLDASMLPTRGIYAACTRHRTPSLP